MRQRLYLVKEYEERVWRMFDSKSSVAIKDILLELVDVLDEESEGLTIKVLGDLDLEVVCPSLGDLRAILVVFMQADCRVLYQLSELLSFLLIASGTRRLFDDNADPRIWFVRCYLIMLPQLPWLCRPWVLIITMVTTRIVGTEEPSASGADGCQASQLIARGKVIIVNQTLH